MDREVDRPGTPGEGEPLDIPGEVERLEIAGDLSRAAIEALALDLRRLARRHGVEIRALRIEKVDMPSP
jgi:hypothetical protein